MREELRKNLSRKSALTGLTLITLLFGFLTALFGELALPLYAAALALLFVCDTLTHRLLSIFAPLAVIGINILLGNYVATAAVFAIPAAALIAFAYAKRLSKGEYAGYVTAIYSVMIVVGVFALAMLAVGEFSFTAANGYLADILNGFTDRVLKSIEEASASQIYGELSVDPETISALFESFLLVAPSFVVMIAFLLCGITFKLFSFMVSRISAQPRSVYSWRFSTNSIFAYFYVALVIFGGLIGAADVFGIALANVQNVFMAVYAYIGFNYLYFLLSRKRSSFFVAAILVVALLMLSSLALSLLSFLGVYFTVMKNKSLSGNKNAG